MRVIQAAPSQASEQSVFDELVRLEFEHETDHVPYGRMTKGCPFCNGVNPDDLG
jgi:hypothetical protein